MKVTATARKWDHGWELWIDGEAATQVGALSQAEQQVRNYLDTVEPETDHSRWVIEIVPDIGELGAAVSAARAATEQASSATKAAAAKSRQVASLLRAAGFSVGDSAAILGVSPGRVSQLVRK